MENVIKKGVAMDRETDSRKSNIRSHKYHLNIWTEDDFFFLLIFFHFLPMADVGLAFNNYCNTGWDKRNQQF